MTYDSSRFPSLGIVYIGVCWGTTTTVITIVAVIVVIAITINITITITITVIMVLDVIILVVIYLLLWFYSLLYRFTQIKSTFRIVCDIDYIIIGEMRIWLS